MSDIIPKLLSTTNFIYKGIGVDGIGAIDQVDTNIADIATVTTLVNTVQLQTAGSATDFLNAQGNYVTESGSGDVIGPISAINSNVAAFDGITGKIIKDSGVQLQTGGSASSFLNAQGNYVTETGSGDVIGPGSSVSGNISSFGDATGKVIADSGIAASLVTTNQTGVQNNSIAISEISTQIFRFRSPVVTTATADSDGFNLIKVNSATPVTITLLTADITAGLTVTIKDISGDASTNNITIVTEGSQLIDGQSTYVIAKNLGEVILLCDSASVSIVSRSSNGPSPFAQEYNSTTDQVPAILDTAQDISFGPDLAGTGVSLASDVFTFNESGVYSIIVLCRVARGASVGIESLVFAAIFNGGVAGAVQEYTLENTDDTETFSSTLTIYLSVGTTFSVQIATIFATGGLDIGLYELPTTVATWGNPTIPAAFCRIDKLDI